MSFNSKRVGARSSRVGKGFLGGQWKVALVALLLPMSMFVASSSGAAPKAHAVTHEPVSWFKTQLAADYSLSTAGLPPTTAPAHKKGEKVWVISCGQASCLAGVMAERALSR